MFLLLLSCAFVFLCVFVSAFDFACYLCHLLGLCVLIVCFCCVFGLLVYLFTGLLLFVCVCFVCVLLFGLLCFEVSVTFCLCSLRWSCLVPCFLCFLLLLSYAFVFVCFFVLCI